MQGGWCKHTSCKHNPLVIGNMEEWLHHIQKPAHAIVQHLPVHLGTSSVNRLLMALAYLPACRVHDAPPPQRFASLTLPRSQSTTSSGAWTEGRPAGDVSLRERRGPLAVILWNVFVFLKVGGRGAVFVVGGKRGAPGACLCCRHAAWVHMHAAWLTCCCRAMHCNMGVKPRVECSVPPSTNPTAIPSPVRACSWHDAKCFAKDHVCSYVGLWQSSDFI